MTKKIKDSVIAKKIKEIRFPSLSLVKPSGSLITFVLIALSLFFLGGGVYNLLEEPLAFLPTPSRPIFYYPGFSEQTFIESLYSIFFLAIGTLGGFLSFWSLRYQHRPRETKIILIVGIVMFILFLLSYEWIRIMKQAI